MMEAKKESLLRYLLRTIVLGLLFGIALFAVRILSALW